MSYHHLTMDERNVIYRMQFQGYSQAEIARHPSARQVLVPEHAVVAVIQCACPFCGRMNAGNSPVPFASAREICTSHEWSPS